MKSSVYSVNLPYGGPSLNGCEAGSNPEITTQLYSSLALEYEINTLA